MSGTWHWRGLTPLIRLTSSTWRVVASDEADAGLAGFVPRLFDPAR